MKTLGLLLTIMLMPVAASAHDVLLLQSSRNPAYGEAVDGLKHALAIQTRTVVISDFAEVDVDRMVREEEARVVVAIGDEALAAAKHVRHAPVVALMTLGLRNGATKPANVTGIDMYIPPERYFPIFNELKARKVGVVYNDSNTGWYVRRAITAARQAGIDIIAVEAKHPRQTPALLNDLAGKVDALWVIPDSVAVVKENVSSFFSFSARHRVPVISFTASHLRVGAAAALEIDRRALGGQAGEMTLKLLNGGKAASIAVSSPSVASVKTNEAVIKSLGARKVARH